MKVYHITAIQHHLIIEDGTIKYIDYDLDLKIYIDGKYKILDKMHYKYHKKLMNYPETIDGIVNESLEELIKLYGEWLFLVRFRTKYAILKRV